MTFAKQSPIGISLSTLFFNIYTYNLPSMTSQKYAYADDLALLYASRDWKAVEDTLSRDMTTLSAYLQYCWLKLSNTKTATAAFHLNNREAKRELNVYNNGNLLPPCPVPTYLGVKLDRSLTFRHHIEAVHISALSLIYSLAEYCTPVWCRSTYTLLIRQHSQ